jgi:hypothetical protein
VSVRREHRRSAAEERAAAAELRELKRSPEARKARLRAFAGQGPIPRGHRLRVGFRVWLMRGADHELDRPTVETAVRETLNAYAKRGVGYPLMPTEADVQRVVKGLCG